MINFYIQTLGCKANQYESEKLAKLLASNGLTYSNQATGLDLIIINTCSVTHVAERKSRQLIRKLAKNNPNADIYITGCAAVSDKERLIEIAKVDFIIEKKDVLEKILINKYNNCKKTNKINIPDNKTRSYLMIETGCDNFCSYCIIPYTRGPVISRNFEEICKEAKELINNGSKEIIITGINIGKYIDKEKNITNICQYIIENSKDTRVRISSIEPNLIPEDLINLIQTEKRMCKHLHIPLQGGCDQLLKDMNRKYTTKEYSNLINVIRKKIPNISITTDLIIGYPTETEDFFIKTTEFIKQCNFSKIHIFPFSKRSGTEAAKIKKQINPEIIKQRIKSIQQIEEEMKSSYLNNNIGCKQQILIETFKNQQFTGFTSNYIKVILHEKNLIINHFYKIKLTSIINKEIHGEILK